MVSGLESKVGPFEKKVLEDIGASLGNRLLKGGCYFGSVDVKPGTLQDILDYLKAHQQEYGRMPRVDPIDNMAISLSPTKRQAIRLAKAIDSAYSGDEKYGPLENITDLSVSGLTENALL